MKMPQAELVIEVQHVRAWPSSAFPSAGTHPCRAMAHKLMSRYTRH